MIAKLTKYEFRSCIKIMSVLWCSLIAISILFSVSKTFNTVVAHRSPSDFISYIIATVSLILYGLLVSALVVVGVTIIIQRFNNSLLGDEGYLMNTLPVKKWQLITSKGIIALFNICASIVVIIISVLILNRENIVKDFVGIAAEFNANSSLYYLMPEALILMILGILVFIYQIYASISIGQLFNKYRVLAAVAAFILINIVLTTIGTVVERIVITNLYGFYVFISNGDHTILEQQILLLIIFIIEVALIMIYHIIAERILTKRLNLL
jgi:hypothetical protein